MKPVTKNMMLASGDCVAIDAVAASMMGFDPMDSPFIRLAHERGLGVGSIEDIEIVGDVDVKRENWQFVTGNNAASSVGNALWFGPLRYLQKLFFHTPLVYVFILASAVYHDRIWYPRERRKTVETWLRESPWGRLFEEYQPGGKTAAASTEYHASQ